MNITRKHRILLTLLTGVLLWAGWPARGFPFLLLIAFCPLLLVQESLLLSAKQSLAGTKKQKSRVFFGYAYLAMLVWNGLSTWWVANSTIVGGIAAIVLNALFMAVVLWLFYLVRRKLGNLFGFIALVVFWMAFEYLHLNWQLSWPWLTLGFGFSNYTSCIQWYEYTGQLGGTLWILLSNIALFFLLKNILQKVPVKKNIKQITAMLVICLLPLLLSYYISIMERFYYRMIGSKAIKHTVVVVQPNIDPYNEKFSGDFPEQVKKMLELANTEVDSNTSYLFFPETALTEPIWENNLKDNASIPLLINYTKKHPGLIIITGAATAREYEKGDSVPESARKYEEKGNFIDYYNTALQIDSSGKIDVYHKSKLVPGVEFMPFSKLLGSIAFNLGGTSGTLGTQKEPTVFTSPYSNITVAPSICYESIYGDYMREFVKKGANFIAVITNDGWWEDTPGYRQHLCYGRLLAIETREYVVQCANTGTSAIIDNNGNVLQSTPWWKPAVIKASIPATFGSTFYVLHGDYLGRWACWISLIIIAFALFKWIKR